ncbi:precorrin-4 C(11)-methyltransferase [Desulfospira joergensenii]|uniref:precorrin-4 C(11)-methyltransferase n=1 Tax=Desulfospira joergensenii TaxID=53329 RepID=UPI0003B6FB25|nr:precorrin-4 C(11)-methyltransferase [Desulfospira joergensenii]
MEKNKKKVVFAGAGPGDPELMTIKSMKAIQEADLVIYAGSLVPEAVLCWKGEQTRTVSSADMNLDQIIDMICQAHGEGKRVVRLHTGDPSMYGAIFEQIRELEKLDIPCRVLPGVTAAFAASAKMKMEFTLPEVTQTLILTRIAGRTPVPDTEDLDRLAAHGSSMAIYLSMAHTEKVQTILKKHYGKDSTCAVAYKVSHPEEKILYCKTGELTRTCQENDITRHALILVGRAVEASMGNSELIKSKLYDPGFSHGYRKSE